jgi:hypothetical protein
MKKGTGEYEKYYNDVLDIVSKDPKARPTDMAKDLASKYDFDYSDRFRRVVSVYKKRALGAGSPHTGLAQECEKVGIPIDDVNHYWYKGQHYSVHVKGDEFDPVTFTDELVEEIRKWSPKYKKIKRAKSKDPHCLVFDPADIHIGKLCSSFETGEEYDSQVAIKRVREGLTGILQKSNGWNIDKVIFVVGNDALHTDNPRRQTTSGTPQDTDGMWYENFTTAKRLLIEVIETLVTVADVEVVYNPSNHDFMSGFMLIQAVEAWFRKSKNITFKTDMSHRKYSTYGKNLIGTTHMDGAKMADLPLLMANEASGDWHHCKHRYIYGHHIHHKTSKDFMSVCVETLRSPSGTDSWHHRNGYQFAPKAIEGFIHHPEHGQVARLTHIF